ncbi:hypothetical protein MMC31_002484 [Peltigera leucophlebia]|nr:hypothetical protein [Peltigera leucophlebia]
MEGNSTSPSPYSPIDPPESIVTMSRASSGTSGGRLRSASLRFLESGPPLGAWHAAGEALGKAPTHTDIRRGSFSHSGWDSETQRRHSSISSNDPTVKPIGERTFSSTSQPPQTPGSGRGSVPLGPHPEIENEMDIFLNYSPRGEMSDQVFTPRSLRQARTVKDEDDDDEYIAPNQQRRLPKKFREAPVVVPVATGKPMAAVIEEPSASVQGPNADGVYPNGYRFPPKHTTMEALNIGFIAFCKYFITPLGFMVVIYCLNIVAWGGMLFLLLVGGGNKYMCYPRDKPPGFKDCNDLYSPRRIWLEIDSQILNALFCVTGFGLIPWRFRDLFYLLQYRLLHKTSALRRLGGIHNGWFRLPGSENLPVPEKPRLQTTDDDALDNENPSLPLPLSKTPEVPLTGIRAPPTAAWKLDYVIWAMVLNTFLQCVLCGFMWGYNRFDRPSWATGTFIALACIVAALGGLMTFQEARKVKEVEGIPPEVNEVVKDVEKAIVLKKVRNPEKKQTAN